MELFRIDLNLLVSLDVLLAEMNVTKAAARLHISQPAMSAQLSRLRELLGDPLLVPIQKGRSMTPTSRALSLKGPLRSALKTLGAVIQSEIAFDPGQDVRAFRIAASDTALNSLCAPLIARTRSQAGNRVQISINVPDPEHIARQMEEGDFDVLIDSSSEIPKGLNTFALQEESFVMAQRTGHPRGTAPLTLKQYCSLNHLIVSPERGSFRGYMDKYISSAGLKRNVCLAVPQACLVSDILRSSDLVCTMPRMLTDASTEGIETFSLPFESEQFQLLLAWHPRNDLDAANEWLRGQIKSI